MFSPRCGYGWFSGERIGEVDGASGTREEDRGVTGSRRLSVCAGGFFVDHWKRVRSTPVRALMGEYTPGGRCQAYGSCGEA